mgnify:CR=1 FL=1
MLSYLTAGLLLHLPLCRTRSLRPTPARARVAGDSVAAAAAARHGARHTARRGGAAASTRHGH